MFAMLASVPGKLKTLLDRLTTTRADNLDKLDANISTRAASSTALSTATWTGTLATNLGTTNTRVDTTVSSRAAATNPLISPPMSGGLPIDSGNSGSSPGTGATLAARVAGTLFTTTSSTYVDALNITGAGVLNFLAIWHSSTNGTVCTVTIDGVALQTDVSNGTDGFVKPLVGVFVSSTVPMALDQIPFKTSLRVQIKTSGGTASAVIKYRRTS